MYEWRFRLMFLLGKKLLGKYGLTIDPPADRHRWLFSLREARSFVQERGSRQGFKVREEVIGYFRYRRLLPSIITAIGKGLGQAGINLFTYHYWAVLERK